MSETILQVVGLVLVFGFVAGIVLLDILGDRAERREHAKMLKDIEHLPLDVQVRILQADLRCRAERDLH